MAKSRNPTDPLVLPKDASHFTFMSANVCGLKGCHAEISELLKFYQPDVFAIQETKIGKELSDEDVAVEGYRIFRKDRVDISDRVLRKRNYGGGVALYIKDNLIVDEVDSDLTPAELKAVRCHFGECTIIATSIYRPPKHTKTARKIFVEHLRTYLDSLGDRSNLILIMGGDTNICNLIKKEFALMHELCDEAKIRQIITVKTHDKRLIDHIYVSENATPLIYSSGLLPRVEILHSSVFLVLKIQRPATINRPNSGAVLQQQHVLPYTKPTNWELMDLLHDKISQLLRAKINSTAPQDEERASDWMHSLDTITIKCSLILANILTKKVGSCMVKCDFPTIWEETVLEYNSFAEMNFQSSTDNDAYLELDSRLSEKYYGFRKGRSTVDALLIFQHYVFRGFERCENSGNATNVCAVFFDIAKCLNVISIEEFLTNLLTSTQEYPLSKQNQYLTAYLNSRTARAGIAKALGESICIDFERSSVGQIILRDYINALAEIDLPGGSELIFCAGELVLIQPMDDPTEAQDQIQQDINAIKACLDNLKMHITPSHCEYMVISLNRHGPTPGTVLKLGDDSLKQVETHIFLGIVIDQAFSFKEQVKKVRNDAEEIIKLKFMNKWKKQFALLRSTAISAVVLPALFHAVEVWYPTSKKLQNELEHVQEIIARSIGKKKKGRKPYSLEEVLVDLKWKPIYRQVAERRLLNVRQYLDEKRYLPPGIFEPEHDALRRSERFTAQQNNTRCLKISAGNDNKTEDKMCAAESRRLWNSLSDSVVKLSFTEFREQIQSDAVFNLLIRAQRVYESQANV